MIILGIESSCDDTCAAVLSSGPNHGPGEPVHILANEVAPQHELHAPFGGIVPEIAARAHAQKLDITIAKALEVAKVGLPQVDLIAVTAGPGLIGGLLAGLASAKALALASDTPMIAVNHLAGHALTPGLSCGIAPPFLMLLVSGGHCLFLGVFGPQDFQRIGGTIDDAPGEAFDKVAKLLALPQPGGPHVEQMATAGDPKRFALPRPLLGKNGADMSFSGLKTALRRARDDAMNDGQLKTQDRNDLCAGFQAAVVDVLAAKSAVALGQFKAICAERGIEAPLQFAVAGGVAANGPIRAALTKVAADRGARFSAPPLKLCTDNAAMIAYAGLLAYNDGARSDFGAPARSRWPLDERATPMLGSGKRGAKA